MPGFVSWEVQNGVNGGTEELNWSLKYTLLQQIVDISNFCIVLAHPKVSEGLRSQPLLYAGEWRSVPVSGVARDTFGPPDAQSQSSTRGI